MEHHPGLLESRATIGSERIVLPNDELVFGQVREIDMPQFDPKSVRIWRGVQIDRAL